MALRFGESVDFGKGTHIGEAGEVCVILEAEGHTPVTLITDADGAHRTALALLEAEKQARAILREDTR
jgi:hypothetical protein